VLYVYFDMSNSAGFISASRFNYGIYVDGVVQGFGSSSNRTVQYTQSTTGTAAIFGASGVSVGTQTLTALAPISIPVYLSPTSVNVTIGITNSSFQMYTTTTIAPMNQTNVTTSTGTPNTTNWVPQNTFTTTGTATYTVPTTVQGGSVAGIYVYLWASGGGNGGANAAGGGGAYVTGFYSVAAGTVITYTVGAVGGNTLATGFGGAGYWAGGGFSGVWSSTTTGGIAKGNLLACAGGGGGAGGGGSNGSGGGGGFPNGADGLKFWAADVNAAKGGSQTAAGAGSIPGGAAGNGQQGGAGAFAAGGGGGGWFGGGGGGSNQDAGAGGSSYVGGSITGSSTANGTTQVPNQGSGAANGAVAFPGGTSSPVYVSPRGRGDGQSGLVVIIPAVGAQATSVAADARILAL